MKGIGKSQIAKAYAYNLDENGHILYKDGYNLVWWFNASLSLELQFKVLCEAWNQHLPFWNENLSDVEQFTKIAIEDEPENYIEPMKQFFRRTTKSWLLIFDNASNYEEIKKYMPSKGASIQGKHIIATSKNRLGWNSLLPLTVFEPKESVQLLERITKRGDEKGALSLAGNLKQYPLAITQAGAYLSQHPNLRYEDYEKYFLTRRQKLWEVEEKLKHTGKSIREYDDYELTFKAAFELTLYEISNHYPLALSMFKYCAFLHHTAIPEILLKKLVEQERGDPDFDFDQAISWLIKYSIMQPDVTFFSTNKVLELGSSKSIQTYSFHELLQIVLQDTLSPETAKEKLTKLEPILASQLQFVKRDQEAWLISQSLAPHAKVFLEYVEKSTLPLSDSIKNIKLNTQASYIDKFIAIEKEQRENREVQDLDESELNQKIESEKYKLKNINIICKEQSITYYNIAKYNYFLHRKTRENSLLLEGQRFLDMVGVELLGQTNKAYFFNIKGLIYQGLSEFNNNEEKSSDIALRSYIDSLEITEKQYKEVKRLHPDSQSEDYKVLQELYQEIARLKNNIGQIYVYLKNNPKKGSEFIKEAINIEEEIYGHLKSANFFWNLYDAYTRYQLSGEEAEIWRRIVEEKYSKFLQQ